MGGGGNKKKGNEKGTKKTEGTKKEEKKDSIKLLLLGTGESGKSTFYKQVRSLYGEPFTKEELAVNLTNIYGNILNTTAIMCKSYVIENKISWENPENKDKATEIIEIGEDVSNLVKASELYTKEVHDKVVSIWKDSAMKDSLNFKKQFHIFDGSEYFFNKLEKLAPPDYVPDLQDALNTRRRTLGISSINFDYNKKPFQITDVGGQRSERSRWEKVKAEANVCVFVVALSDYNTLCFEDDKTNRLAESLKVFDETVNSDVFKAVPIILLFNKEDIFIRKLKDDPFKNYFENYTGENDPDTIYKYIIELYLAENKFDKNRIHVYKGNSIDSNNMKEVSSQIFDQCIKFTEVKKDKDKE